MSSSYLRTRPDPALLSLVAPCYNEEQSLPLFAAEINRFIDALTYPCEVVLVNDGSSDRTIELLAEWSERDSRIKVLSLSRNFGHQLAATAGVDYATGDAVVLIDADLQDPLDVIHEMVAQYRKGYDVVCGQRSVRKGENLFKRVTAWCFYRLMQTFFLKSLPPDVGDFRLMSRRCVDSLRSMRELHRFLRGMVAWVGYPQICVRYERQPRVAGTTKYPLRKMIRLAWSAAVSFSPLPLRMSFYAALFMVLLALEEATRALYAYISGNTVPGWTSIMIQDSLSNAVIFTILGILGEYVAKIYEESQGRPLYIVADTWNVSEPPGDPSQPLRKAVETGGSPAKNGPEAAKIARETLD